MVEPELPDSPFLPGTHIQYAWDSTSLGYIKTCPRLYYYQMIQGWQPKDQSVHLRFGIEYAHAQNAYQVYRHNGDNHSEALHKVVKELLLRTGDWDSDNPYKNRKTLTRTVIWYLEKFQHDTTKTLELADGKISSELSFRFQLDWGPKDGINTIVGDEVATEFAPQPYLLCGHLDRVVTFNDEIFVMDQKTTKTTPGSYYFDQYEPENQMSLYTLAGQILFDTPIRGVIIDVAQVAINFSHFERGFTYRNSDQIDEWVNDLHFWFALAENFAKANYWPMNDKACGMYGGCKFREICSKSPSVRERFLSGNFVKGEPWNPLKVR
jgi:hypothetical protein